MCTRVFLKKLCAYNMCFLWLLYHSWNLFKRSWRVDEPVQFAAAVGYTSLGIADYALLLTSEAALYYIIFTVQLTNSPWVCSVPVDCEAIRHNLRRRIQAQHRHKQADKRKIKHLHLRHFWKFQSQPPSIQRSGGDELRDPSVFLDYPTRGMCSF